MGYTKKWIPPSIPYRDNLPAWKAVFGDLHQNLLDAGLVQTDTEGQLVIDEVAALPADGSYAGFIEYAFNDDLQEEAPVVIKIEYGCGKEGLSFSGVIYARSRALAVRCTIYFDGVPSSSFFCPQASVGSNNVSTQLTHAGLSTLCSAPERGFLGVIYGAGSANRPFAHSNGSYYGSRLTIFVQRTVDASGQPTGEGLLLYMPNLSFEQSAAALWQNGNLSVSQSQYLNRAGAQGASAWMALRLGQNENAVVDGVVQTQQIFAATPAPVAFPWIVSYATPHGGHSIPEGSEFELEVLPGTKSNFIALGNETCISIDNNVGQRAGVAMLFE